MTVTAEAGLSLDFWLRWVWSDLKPILLILAAIEVVVLWSLRRTAGQRVAATVVGGLAAAGGWVAMATSFYVAVRLTPSGTPGTSWMGLAIVLTSALVVFLGTAVVFLKLTGSRSNPRYLDSSRKTTS